MVFAPWSFRSLVHHKDSADQLTWQLSYSKVHSVTSVSEWKRFGAIQWMIRPSPETVVPFNEVNFAILCIYRCIFQYICTIKDYNYCDFLFCCREKTHIWHMPSRRQRLDFMEDILPYILISHFTLIIGRPTYKFVGSNKDEDVMVVVDDRAF